MFPVNKIFLLYLMIISLSFNFSVKSEIVSNIKILGNDRIPNETILMLSDLKIGNDISKKKLNDIIISLY